MAEFKSRIEELVSKHKASLKKDLADIFSKKTWEDGWVLPSSSKETLLKKYEIANFKELMVLMAAVKHKIALADVSNYEVQIVGQEKSGDLIFGGNLEFPGSDLGITVHAEQFLFARAFHRGSSIESIALDEPTPCGHCRQFIMEFENAKNIRVYNSLGFDLRVGDLLPFAFGPEQLGKKGIELKNKSRSLKLKSTKISPKVNAAADAALAAANKSYSPYSDSPSGAAILSDIVVPGSYIENAAFNPSLSPFHCAVINLVASGRSFGDIEAVVLVQKAEKVDQEERTKALLSVVAPKARLIILEAV